jgi:hypothetical protein
MRALLEWSLERRPTLGDTVRRGTRTEGAALACLPAVVTLVIAFVADPAHAGLAGTWNARAMGRRSAVSRHHRLRCSDRAAAAVSAPRAGGWRDRRGAVRRTARPLDRGAFDSLGPISFVVLMACLGLFSAIGRLSDTDVT